MAFKKCRRPCKFRSGTPNLNGCDYLLLTGTVRGCPAGEQCTRFEEGEKIQNRVDILIPTPEKLSDQERDVKDYIESHKQKIKNREL